MGSAEAGCLLAEHVDQLVERLLERRHPLALELGGDVVDVDADLGELGPDAVDLVHVGVDGAGDDAVVGERLQCGVRQGVHGVRADQAVDVQRVGVVGVLRPGGGPQRTLDARPRAASASQRGPENVWRNSR